jgi:hypothetical protein
LNSTICWASTATPKVLNRFRLAIFLQGIAQK